MKKGLARVIIGSVVSMLFVAGCAAPQKEAMERVFYPAPPELPRVQFLTFFTGAKDIEPEKSGFETFVTGEKESVKRLDKPYGVAIYDGKIYVCDTNATVMVFDLVKKTYSALEGAKGLGKLVQPINISIDREGNKYVTDPIRGQVVMFDRKDFYVKAFGLPGGWKPVHAVPYQDRLYVADIDNSAIKVFDKETGAIVKVFGDKGENETLLDRPLNLAIGDDGMIYVTDGGRFQVLRYDRDGHFLGSIGKLGLNVGHFSRPRGIALDRKNRVYVVDASFYNVQIFNREGQNLFYFGEGGTKPGKLILPAQVVVDYENMKYFEKYVDPNFNAEHLVIVTSQFGDQSVSVFAYGAEKGKQYPTDTELLDQLKERLQRKLKQEEPGPPAEGEQAK